MSRCSSWSETIKCKDGRALVTHVSDSWRQSRQSTSFCKFTRHTPGFGGLQEYYFFSVKFRRKMMWNFKPCEPVNGSLSLSLSPASSFNFAKDIGLTISRYNVKRRQDQRGRKLCVQLATNLLCGRCFTLHRPIWCSREIKYCWFVQCLSSLFLKVITFWVFTTSYGIPVIADNSIFLLLEQ